MTKIDSKIPEGQLAEKWSNYKAHQKLVNPANKRRLDIIVVGTGLAGASAAASLGEISEYSISVFRIHPAVLTLLQHRVVSTQLKTIKMMVTRFTVFSTIQSKAVTTVHAKPTFTVWLRYQTLSSTNA